jgi:hypothetical protein
MRRIVAARKAGTMRVDDELMQVLKEFTSDVRVAYSHDMSKLKDEWPDLYVTYQHALEVLRLARKETLP